MPRFSFKYQKILDYKSEQVESLQKELSKRQITLNRIEAEKEALALKRDNVLSRWRRTMEGMLDINELIMYRDYLSDIKNLLEQKEIQRRTAQKSFDETKKRLISAKKGQKVLEKLKKKAWRTHVFSEMKEVQKFLDEFGNNSFFRKLWRN